MPLSVKRISLRSVDLGKKFVRVLHTGLEYLAIDFFVLSNLNYSQEMDRKTCSRHITLIYKLLILVVRRNIASRGFKPKSGHPNFKDWGRDLPSLVLNWHLGFIKSFFFAHKPRNKLFLHLEQEFNGGPQTGCNYLKSEKRKTNQFVFIL